MPNRKRIFRDDEIATPIRGVVGSKDPVELPQELVRIAHRLRSMREARTAFFEAQMFGEPAWDILLSLYIAHGRGYVMKVSDACFEAMVPATTAIRWIEYLVENGYVTKRADQFDRRVTYVELTQRAALTLNQCLRRMAGVMAQG